MVQEVLRVPSALRAGIPDDLCEVGFVMESNL